LLAWPASISGKFRAAYILDADQDELELAVTFGIAAEVAPMPGRSRP